MAGGRGVESIPELSGVELCPGKELWLRILKEVGTCATTNLPYVLILSLQVGRWELFLLVGTRSPSDI